MSFKTKCYIKKKEVYFKNKKQKKREKKNNKKSFSTSIKKLKEMKMQYKL